MIQICGTILIGMCLICGTWYAVTVRKIKAESKRKETAQRNAHNEKLAADNNFALYQQTEASLSQAQSKPASLGKRTDSGIISDSKNTESKIRRNKQ